MQIMFVTSIQPLVGPQASFIQFHQQPHPVFFYIDIETTHHPAALMTLQEKKMTRWMAALLLAACLPAAAASMSSNQFDDFRGQYQLKDGRTLTMVAVGRRFVAEVDGIGRIEVIPAGDAVFKARDGSLVLTFERWPNGNVTEVALVEYEHQGAVAERAVLR